MIASQCSFEQMMQTAAGNPTLALATSYIQVEYGIADLKSCWYGFVDTSDCHSLQFKSRKHICAEFANALSDYIEYLGESSHLEVGS